MVSPPEIRRRLLNDYVEIFANRDIRQVLSIDSSDRFEQLIRLIGARTTQVLNYNGLASDLAIPVNTVRRWVDALKRSYLVETIPAYTRNAGHRVIKAPKLFMTDSALALAAARELQPTGFSLENLVATDLLIWRDASPERAIYHWRTQSGREVDFVIDNGGRLLPVEVKKASSVGTKDIRHLEEFLRSHGEATRGVILSSDSEIREVGSRVIAAPWWAVL